MLRTVEAEEVRGQTTEARAGTGYGQSGSGQTRTHFPFLVEQPQCLYPSRVSLLSTHTVLPAQTQVFASSVPSTQDTSLFSPINSYSTLRAQTEVYIAHPGSRSANAMLSGGLGHRSRRWGHETRVPASPCGRHRPHGMGLSLALPPMSLWVSLSKQASSETAWHMTCDNTGSTQEVGEGRSEADRGPQCQVLASLGRWYPSPFSWRGGEGIRLHPHPVGDRRASRL